MKCDQCGGDCDRIYAALEESLKRKPMRKMKEDEVYVFRLRDRKGFPVACVASRLRGQFVHYAISVCNPSDTYNRELARSLAVGRLLDLYDSDNHAKVSFYTIRCDDPSEARINVLRHILIVNKSVPQRVKEAVMENMNYRGSYHRKMRNMDFLTARMKSQIEDFIRNNPVSKNPDKTEVLRHFLDVLVTTETELKPKKVS